MNETTTHPNHSTFIKVNQPYGMPGCTNGRSGQVTEIGLVGAREMRAFDRLDLTDPDDVERHEACRNLFEVVLWKPCGSPAAHLRPVVKVPAGAVGYMAGGNTVAVVDLPTEVQDAVRAYGVTGDTIKIHDRYETTEQYAALSSD